MRSDMDLTNRMTYRAGGVTHTYLVSGQPNKWTFE